MNIKINFHQMESTDAITAIVEKKSKKLKKFFNSTTDIEWFLEVKKDGHSARALLDSKGYHINADAKTHDLYKAIDDVISKLEIQIKKKVSKSKDHSNDKLSFDEESDVEDSE